jgi:hypothetical protein
MDAHDLDPDSLPRLVEQLILEQQRYEPLELLLATGILAYPDYEAWRSGRRASLQGALRLALADTLALLRRADAQARAAGLVAAPADHRRWGEEPAPLEIGPSTDLSQALAIRYSPPPERRQLDLFYDSASVALEERLRDAVLARRFGAARQVCDKLSERDPAHSRLADWWRLIDLLESSPGKNKPQSPEADVARRLRDIDSIAPIADRLLDHGARDCLALLWSELARAAAGLAFDPAEPRLHASHALARLGRWQEVRAAIEAEPHWRDQPLLLAPHAQACWRAGDRRAALADWLGLCWAHPDAAEAALGAGDCPDQWLAARWNEFCDLDPHVDSPAAQALDTADFPAWLLLVEPALVADAPADPAAAGPERAAAYRAAQALARAPDDVAQRRALGAAHRTLLAVFLEVRARVD